MKPVKEQIELRAYELYLERDCEPGRELEDWLAAEKEIESEMKFTESNVEEVRESEAAERHAQHKTKTLDLNWAAAVA